MVPLQIINTYISTEFDMKPYIREVVKHNIRVLLFYGDADYACNIILGQRFTAELKLQVRCSESFFEFIILISRRFFHN